MLDDELLLHVDGHILAGGGAREGCGVRLGGEAQVGGQLERTGRNGREVGLLAGKRFGFLRGELGQDLALPRAKN